MKNYNHNFPTIPYDLPIPISDALIHERYWAAAAAPTSACASAALEYINAIAENRRYASAPTAEALRDADITQIAYILCNLQGWRGPAARSSKKILNAFCRDKQPTTPVAEEA